MQRRQGKEIVTSAVQMAVWHAQPEGEVILHSDRGTQYTSYGYQRFLKENNITSSISAVGSCAGNAAVESFFGLLKENECIVNDTKLGLTPERMCLIISSASTTQDVGVSWR